jgi:hypothetical protein
MLLQARPKKRDTGKIRKVETRDLNPRRLRIPKEDAVTLNHLVVREELVLARERTDLLATEVGGRLGYATTSKRVLVPKEKSATTYMKRSAPGHLHLKVVAERAGLNAHSSSKELVSSATPAGTSTEVALIAAPPTTARAKAIIKGHLNPISLLLPLPPSLPDVTRSRRKLGR